MAWGQNAASFPACAFYRAIETANLFKTRYLFRVGDSKVVWRSLRQWLKLQHPYRRSDQRWHWKNVDDSVVFEIDVYVANDLRVSVVNINAVRSKLPAPSGTSLC